MQLPLFSPLRKAEMIRLDVVAAADS